MASLGQLKELNDEEFLASVNEDLRALESVRHAKLERLAVTKRIAKLAAIVGAPFTGFIDYMMLLGSWAGDDPGAGLTIAYWAGLWYWSNGPKRAYLKRYKEAILPKIASTLGNLQYQVSSKKMLSFLKDSKIPPHYNRSSCEDYFHGSYKGAEIEFSEATLEYKSSGKNSSTRTVFKGLIFSIGLPRPISGHTIIIPNDTKFIEWFKQKGTGLERADLVDPRFEKLYDAYTNDQVEARYLVHPVIIERFVDLANEYNADTISGEYRDNKLLLLVPSYKNHFEPGDIYTEATNIDSLLNIKHELGAVMGIVDQLQLTRA